MKILKYYLKKYSLKRISEITGISINILKRLKQGRVKFFIEQTSNGEYCPSYSILTHKIKERMKEHQKGN